MAKIKILVFPHDNNPYQKELYGNMPPAEVEFRYLKKPTNSRFFNALMAPFQLFWPRLLGYRILHIHWLHTLSLPGSRKSSAVAFASMTNMYFFVFLASLLNYKVVWTVHNILPHAKLSANDLGVRKYLATKAALLIVHTDYTKQQLEESDISSVKAITIPHGNYCDAYPNSVDRLEARAKLGIEKDVIVLLFLGSVQRYKGVDLLTEAFTSIHRQDAMLLIAGRCSDAELDRQLRNECEKSSRIVYENKFIPDDELQIYFNAADYSVLPFRKITTSGSALLSLSFGVPIIAPAIGAINDFPDGVGVLYNETDVAGLKDSINKAINFSVSKTKHLKENALAHAKDLNWASISELTCDVFCKLLEKNVN